MKITHVNYLSYFPLEKGIRLPREIILLTRKRMWLQDQKSLPDIPSLEFEAAQQHKQRPRLIRSYTTTPVKHYPIISITRCLQQLEQMNMRITSMSFLLNRKLLNTSVPNCIVIS